MSRRLRTEELNKMCSTNPHDLSLKLSTISASLEDLRNIYVAALDQDADAKVNERFFDEFSRQFQVKNANELTHKLEMIRTALEPEGYGINFITAYGKLKDDEKEKLSQNQSSSVAIINYLSARFGFDSRNGYKFLKALYLFKGIQSFFLWLMTIASFGLSVFISFWFIGKTFPLLEPTLPDWAIGIIGITSVIILPVALIFIMVRTGGYLGQEFENLFLNALKRYYQKNSIEHDE